MNEQELNSRIATIDAQIVTLGEERARLTDALLEMTSAAYESTHLGWTVKVWHQVIDHLPDDWHWSAITPSGATSYDGAEATRERAIEHAQTLIRERFADYERMMGRLP